jgi:hypothetical protein
MGKGDSQPATETQKPTQVPNSQGPNTPDTSKQAETIQQPKK